MHKSNKLHIAITGGTGFVGKNLRSLLYKENIEFTSVSRRNFNQYNKLETKIVSPIISTKLSQKLRNCNVMVHLIGIGNQNRNSLYNNINLQLTKNVIALCKKAKITKIIFNSGLGASKNSSTEYFLSKFNAEQEIINSGLDFTIFRPSYIIGKDDLLTKNLKKQIKNKKIIIPGSGKYHIQPISISDVVEIILQASTSKKYSNKIIDLVGPTILTYENYVKLFSKKHSVTIQKIDLEDAYHTALTDPLHSLFGIDDLNILIGNFTGNHKKLAKISNLKFQTINEMML